MIDLARLRRLCEAAIPGPWRWTDFHHLDRRDNPNGITIGGISESDRAYLEAFDPTTVLALLDRIEEAERALAECSAPFMIGDMDGIKWEALAREFNRRQTVAALAIGQPTCVPAPLNDRRRGGAAEKMGTKP